MNPAKFNKDATEHAWRWFEYHANQRMTMIRFYLTVAAAIAAGVGYLWINKAYPIAAMLSIYGALASYCFMKLDRRVSDLVKLGEDPLKTQEAILAKDLGIKEFEISSRAARKDIYGDEHNRNFPYTYGQNLRVMFTAAALIFLFMFFISAVGFYESLWGSVIK